MSEDKKQNKNNNSKILGIDLGTTFSAMAITEEGEPKIIENKEGQRTTPSVVALNKKGERLVGTLARRQQITNPKNTIASIKRLIGRKFNDEDIKRDKKNLSYEIREANNGAIEVKLGDKWYKPVQVSAMILQKFKKDAEDKLGEEIDQAIITCPAYFNDSQRKATKVSGEIAGFEVKRVINEPTAAALAYGLNKKNDHQILVYDFGGGTFDVSILDVSEDTVEVKATGGDNHLGGDDFDQEIMEWMIKEFKKEEGIDLSKDELALQRLKEEAEKAKIELSSAKETEINIPFITSNDQGPKHLNFTFSRAKLEDLVSNYIDRSVKAIKKTLKEANLSDDDIEEIVLVGGQTRMPKIQEEIKNIFGKDPKKDINPDEVVAIGAATQGGIMQGDVKDVLLLDVTPLSLGIETLGGKTTTLIPKNTTIPTSESKVFSTASTNQTSVEINVLQGERTMADDNKSLGRFILDGIPPAPRGVPQIEVKFDIDANGILHVSAKDKGTGKEQSIRIEGSCGLSDEEIEKMKKEAEKHAEEDKKKEDLIEKRNKAQSLIYSAESTLKEAGDKIDDKTKEKIKKEIEELKEVKDGDDPEKIDKKTEEASKVIQKAGAAIYKKQQQEQSSQTQKEEGEETEEAEEAEYKEEDSE